MYHDEYPHNLPHEEALARIKALTDYWDARYHTQTLWDGHLGKISGKVLGFSFWARFTIDADRLHGEMKISFLAVKMGGRKYLQRKLDYYMDPHVPLEKLQALAKQPTPATI